MTLSLFIFSFVWGIISRLLLILSNAIAKRYSVFVTVICDTALGFLLGLPLLIGFHLFGNGKIQFFAVAAFAVGLTLTFLIKRKKNA